MDWCDFVYLAVVCFLTLTCTAAQEGVFESRCDTNQQSMTFTYQSGSEPPTFIFAADHPNDCSLESADPKVTGSGTAADPYTLTINPTVSSEASACGIQKSGSEYSFAVEVRFGVILLIADSRDKTYHVTCDFPTESAHTVLAQYACEGSKKLYFSYATNDSAPADIYAVGKKSTCGKAAGEGMGSATLENRYELTIDLSGTTQSPDCGVQQVSTDTYSVRFIVQSSPSILQADDMTYYVTCNFSQPFTELSSADGITIEKQLTNGSASNLKGDATLTVLDSENNVVNRITLGQLIKLRVELTGADAEGVRVRKCDVKPSVSSSQVINLLDSNGCSIDGEVSLRPFVGSTGTEAYTPTFKTFSFVEANSLVFVCMVDFCYETNNDGCIGDHCSVDLRRRRDTDSKNLEQVKALVVVMDSSSFDRLDEVNSSSPTSSDARFDCTETLYWVVLGFILLTIIVLFIASCLLFCYCIGIRRRAKREKTKGSI
ncbi:uncharacterized protein LOC135478112 [Liolophura sinensis]|uniref:uncharacterized protein LOC135478112 n=1 Tax=Liolophura sinensis TaxID=3198878 RepID=UPI0031599148